MLDSSPHITPIESPEDALGTAIHTIHNYALMMRQTRLDQRQRQYVDRILAAVATLQNILGNSIAEKAPELEDLPPEAPDTLASPSAADASLSCVLLVEDDEINQAIVCELLKNSPFTVDVASSGEEALTAVAGKEYHLIFMDLKMPGMGGLEATKHIRNEGYTMPIVGLTGDTDDTAQEEAVTAGMSDYLTKPIDPTRLFQAIDKWLVPPTSAPRNEISCDTDAANLLPNALNGFNITAGLAAVGNNKQLYADLLERFASRYASVTEDIAACLHRNDIGKAVLLAHTVKGIAANLGATRLAESAGELEKIIAEDPSKITIHLEKLMLCLDEAIAAVRDALGSQAPVQAHDNLIDLRTIVSAEEAHGIASELGDAINRMEQDWNNAEVVAQSAYDILKGSPLEHLSMLLKKAVEDFAPQKAQHQCAMLQNAMQKYFGQTPEQPAQN